jgi:Tfp pilus assembly protein PilX
MKHSLRHRRTSQSTGFALVVSLLLMAFMLLLMLTMSTLVEVETRGATSHLNTLRAKESARLALMMAVGELQKQVGPDQRVTARAEISGGSEPFWTGVWDTTKPTTAPRWLVSWQDQTLPANTQTMQLVGPGSAGTDSTQYVSAPILEVKDKNNNTADKIAWWIGDEGVKASVGELPLHLRSAPNYLKDTSLLALNTMLSSGHGLEELFGDYDRFTSSDANNFERIITSEQLLGQNDFSDRSKWQLSSENEFHCVTPISLGVLASVLPDANGGLMQDLSLFPKLIGAEFEAIIDRAAATADVKSTAATEIDALHQFANLRGLSDLGTLTDGQIAEPITPILSNLMMAFSVHLDTASDNRLYLRMRFFCELWNPFTSSLNMKDADGNALDLELEIYGLPTVRITKGSEESESSALIDLQNIVGNDSGDPDSPMIITLKNGAAEDWLPGRSKNWTGVDADELAGRSPYESIITNSKQWNWKNRTLGGERGIDTHIDLPGKSAHILDSDEEILLQIKLFATNPALGQRSLLCNLDGIRYEPISTTLRSATSNSVNFGYHIILRGPHQSSADPEYYRGLWLKNHDPRNPQPHFYTDWNLDLDPTAQAGSPYVPVKNGISTLLSPQPEDINESGTIHFPIFRRLCDRSSPHFDKLWQDAPLFELPRERPLSLASLQHIYFHNERPFKVGNSWGNKGAINTLTWFDRYYFSGLSRSDTPEDYESKRSLPNPTLLTYHFEAPQTKITHWQTASSDDATASVKLAQNAFVINRFNLNSTSVAAWKAILGGLRINTWDYLDYPESDTSDLSTLSVKKDTIKKNGRERMFARFSQSLSETYEAPQTPKFEGNEPVAPSAYYRRGARYFDANEIEVFATEVVRLIKQKGEPFYSMEEFLSTGLGRNSSLLEQAIATVFAPTGHQRWDHQWETTGVRGPASEVIDIDHFSPGFLTQSDVMTAIGPMLAPRSDTFKIRARGECYSPLGEATGAATLEATFQRTPAAVDSTIPITQATDRKFKLLSIRWLSDDEV